MATYKGIQGFSIQNLSADPTDGNEGQVWYNSTSNVWKVTDATTVGSWATGGNLSTARGSNFGFGTENAAGLSGGGTPTGYSAATEEYNGTAWSGGISLPSIRSIASSCGTLTAAIVFGGELSPGSSTRTNSTVEYDGATWTTGGNLGTARWQINGCGTQTAGLAFGGNVQPTSPNFTAATEEYDGTSWAAGGSLSTKRNNTNRAGVQTAALAAAGIHPQEGPPNALTEEYNGTSWSGGGNVVTPASAAGSDGPQTDAIMAGSSGPSLNVTQTYDGTSWSTATNISTGREQLSGSGTGASSGITITGGFTPAPAVSAATEEWTPPGALVTKTITTS